MSEASVMNDFDHAELTEQIIAGGFAVSNGLGCGFLEKVYENALAHEFRKRHWCVEQQCRIPVHYEGILVGDYVADLLVNRLVLVEVKACQGIDDIHIAQCLNYLKATGLEVCLLMNFGKPKLEIRRLARRDNSPKRVQTGPEILRQMRHI